MENKMFCFQCEQSVGYKECTGNAGICEKKTVCILLTLLHLGIKNILLGPSRRI